jgi:hypothetical protein
MQGKGDVVLLTQRLSTKRGKQWRGAGDGEDEDG